MLLAGNKVGPLLFKVLLHVACRKAEARRMEEERRRVEKQLEEQVGNASNNGCFH